MEEIKKFIRWRLIEMGISDEEFVAKKIFENIVSSVNIKNIEIYLPDSFSLNQYRYLIIKDKSEEWENYKYILSVNNSCNDYEKIKIGYGDIQYTMYDVSSVSGQNYGEMIGKIDVRN